MQKLTLVLLSSVLLVFAEEKTQFQVIKEWDFVNFTWPHTKVHEDALSTRSYMPQNILVAGVIYYDGYYYLSLPRMKTGVPATVARIPEKGKASPLLEPYPSWEMNKLDDCDAIQNSQNVEIDSAGKMWIIDGGKTNTLGKPPTTTCAPKLIIFDIVQNKTLRVHHFLDEVVSKNNSFLYDLVVDDQDGGYAYITDNSAEDPGIVVYSLKEDKSWKIRHGKTMKADPEATKFSVDHISISSPINIAGIALGPKTHLGNNSLTINDDRLVYYTPMSSLHIYALPSSVLRNKTNANNGKDYEGQVQDIGKKSSQTDGMIMDDGGILYYGLLADSSVAKWDSQTPFASGQKLISRDPAYIQWPNSFTFDNAGNIILLTNRLQKFVYGKMDVRQPNFRLMSAHIGSKSYVSAESPLQYNTTGAGNEGGNLTAMSSANGTSPVGSSIFGTTTGTLLMGGSNMTGSNMTGSNMTGSNMSSANMSNSNMSGTNLTGSSTTMTGSGTSGSSITGSTASDYTTENSLGKGTTESDAEEGKEEFEVNERSEIEEEPQTYDHSSMSGFGGKPIMEHGSDGTTGSGGSTGPGGITELGSASAQGGATALGDITGSTTLSPGVSTIAPEGTTASGGSTMAPEGTTVSPTTTTLVPGGTTANSTGSMERDMSGLTTSNPNSNTTTMSGSTINPENSTMNPGSTTTTPGSTTTTPGSTTNNVEYKDGYGFTVSMLEPGRDRGHHRKNALGLSASTVVPSSSDNSTSINATTTESDKVNDENASIFGKASIRRSGIQKESSGTQFRVGALLIIPVILSLLIR